MKTNSVLSELGDGLILAVVVLLIWGGISLIRPDIEEIKKSRDKYRELIGEKIVIRKDTLELLNYNFIMKEYTLSNGVKVDREHKGIRELLKNK